jgi:hypothetical protein
MFFYKNDEFIFMGVLLGGLLFLERKNKIEPFFIGVLAIFFVAEVLQMTFYENYKFTTLLGTLARLMFAYFAVKLTGKNFIPVFIKILYFTAIISLVFYLLTFATGITSFILRNIAPIFKPVFSLPATMRYAYSPNIIVYNYNYEHMAMFRNVGPFWESGAFGVYLVIALIFNMIREKNLFTRINMVFLVSIITTFSTATYLALFFFLTGYYLIRKDVKYKFIYILLAGSVSIYGYFSLTFMQDKILQNIASSNETTKSRFGSAKADLKVFSMSPVFGLGRTEENKIMVSRKLHVLQHRNNGVTGLLASYGLIIFVLYFISYYHSIKRYLFTFYELSNYKDVSYVVLFTIFIIGFSQRIFLLPFFYSIIFLHLVDFGTRQGKQAGK